MGEREEKKTSIDFIYQLDGRHVITTPFAAGPGTRPCSSLARPPAGDWILLDSESWIGPDGTGLAASKLADVNGYFGRAVQSLAIEKR